MSSRVVLYGFLLSLFLALGTGCQVSEPIQTAQKPEVDQVILQVPISPDSQGVIEKSLVEPQKTFEWSKETKGVVIPHHLLQANLVAQAFKGLEAIDPEVVILLSPNHQKEVEHGVVTVSKDLKTYKGVIAISPVTKALVGDMLAEDRPQILLKEYGLTNLLPYIQEMPWKPELIPIVTSRGLSDQELGKIYEAIEKGTRGKRVLWIASVDFSHGLTALESRQRDEVTLKWIREGDVNRILSSGPEHMDNPSGLILWLKAMSSQTLLYQGESGSRSLETLAEAGTSYLLFEGQ